MKKDPRVDAYIEKSAEFARPILKLLRASIHEACPTVEEKIRWGMPSFDLANVPFAQMGAFKAHCRFLIWNSEAIGLGRTGTELFGDIRAPRDLPSNANLVAFVKKAAKIRAQHVADKKAGKIAPTKRKPKPALPMPKDLAAALAKNKKAKSAFDAFAPGHRRDYIEWITSAKQEATRARRLATAMEQIAEGKPQNWKYM